MRLSIILLLLFNSQYIHAQEDNGELNLQFNIVYNDVQVKAEQLIIHPETKEQIYIDVLKFYVSNIELRTESASILREPESYHLIDISNPASLRIPIKNSTDHSYHSVRFNLGVDSLTSVSGAMGGDLDPTTGMYWTWQSGYINFKIEGRSSRVSTPNQEFQFHLGGYQFPYDALQEIELKTQSGSIIQINLDLAFILDRIDLSESNHIMSPGAKAVLISEKVARSFYTIPQ